MKRFFAPLLFPLVLSLLLGGTGFWLNRATDIQIEAVKLDPSKPQYVMYNIRAQRFDLQGKLKDNLNAARAWQMPEERKIFFAAPDIHVWENGKPYYDLTAEEGIYDMDSKQADLTRNVHLLKYNADGKTVATVDSPYLRIDTANKTADTAADEIFHNATRESGTLTPTPKTRIKTVIYDLPKQ